MSGPDDDLHDPKLSELYRQLPDATPSAETDDRIRAAARREVAAGPRPLSRTQQLRRITALAAALLLGIGLTVQWQLRTPREFEAAVHPASAPPPPIQAPPSLSPPAAEAPAPAPAAAPQKPRANAATARANTAPRRRDTIAAAPASPSASAPSAGGAPAAEAQMAEDRLANSSPAPAAVAPAATGGIAPAAEKEQGLAKAPADQRDAAAAGALRREKKAEAAAVAAEAAAPDYRELMRQRRYAQALAALPQSPAMQLDRDLLQRLLGRSTAPACGNLTAEAASEALLCTFLQRQAQGRALPTDWLSQLERAGAFTEEKQYRRPAVLELFSTPAAWD